MTLPISLAAALLVVWLLLPLMMRPAFRNAGLPPTAAATAVLALLFSGTMLLLSDDGTAVVSADIATTNTSEHTALSFALSRLMLELGLIGLAVSGTAMLAKGLMQGSTGGFSLRVRRWMAGLGAYAFHAGTGVIAALAFSHADPAVTTETGPHWPSTLGLLSGALLLSGLGLVVLALLLTLFRRLRAS